MANNREVAHAFAYRNKAKGSNFYSDGEKLMSYQTIMAKWVGNTIIVSRTRHGNATAKQMSGLWSAIRGTTTVNAYAEMNHSEFNPEDSERGYRYEKESILEKLAKAKKPAMYVERLIDLNDQILALYNLTQWDALRPLLLTHEEVTALHGDLAGFLAAKAIADAQRTADQIEKNKKWVAEQEARIAERLATYYNETLPAWRNHTKYSLNTNQDQLDRIRFKYKAGVSDEIETSQEIVVPIPVALRFYAKLDACRQKRFVDCEAMKILDFPVKRIDADRVVIGCHHFDWAEIDLAYKMINEQSVPA